MEIAQLIATGWALGIVAIAALDCRWLSQRPMSFWVAVAVVSAVGAWRTARPNLAASLGLFWLPRYPPTWLAAFIGAALLILYVLLFPRSLLGKECIWTEPEPAEAGVVARTVLGVLGVAIGLAVLTWAGLRQARPKKAETRPAAATTSKTEEFDRLVQWVSADEPIKSAEEDRLGHTPMARRLADLLAGSSTPAVVLVGDQGSGKSSLRNLVSRELEARATKELQIDIVPVSLWPYETSAGAITGVLSAATRQLDRHVSTVPLRGIEADYIEAIEGMGGWVAKATRLARPASPATVLARYDKVAVAIGLKIVLWVEDFERFAGIHADADEPEFVRLAPLRALLAELSGLQGFQVVLASAAADYRFDLQKLARYVIAIPAQNWDAAAAQIALFRRECLQRYPMTDAAVPGVREKMWPAGEELLGWMAAWSGMSLRRALGTLCANPRVLKQVLRGFLESWSKLCGEVDVDELLIVCTLTVACPQVTELINAHIQALKVGSRPRLHDDKKQPPFAREFEGILERMRQADADATRFLVGELFPGWSSGDGGSRDSDRPQGFSATHTDYWLRFQAMSPPAADASDQRMLQVIDNWREGRSTDLPRMMVTGEHPVSLEALFAVRATADELLRLLEEVLEGELASGRRRWGDDEDRKDSPPALVSVWRTMLKKRPAAAKVIPILRSQFQRIVSENAALAFELVYLFVTDSNQVQTLLSSAEIAELRGELERFAAGVFDGRPETLAEALRGTNIYTLNWLCWGLDRIRRGETSGVPVEWDRWARAILAAIRQAPDVMIAQALPFVVKGVQRVDWEPASGGLKALENYAWDREATTRLFGAGVIEDIVRGYPSLRLSPMRAQEMLDRVRLDLMG